MTEPVSAESVTNVVGRFILPHVEDLFRHDSLLVTMDRDNRRAIERAEKRRKLEQALWNVGAAYEDAKEIGRAYYYGEYGDNDY